MGKINADFIPKLQTENYFIGSFDSYLDTTRELIKNNSELTDEEVDKIIKSMEINYRAAIVDKNGNYVGYIGLYDVDVTLGDASIRFEVGKDIGQENMKEVLEEFEKFMNDSLRIKQVNEFIYQTNNRREMSSQEIVSSPSNIIVPNNLLVPGVSESDLAKYRDEYQYSIPKLQMPFTIKSNGRTIGIIGLSNLIWSNKRANLNIFLDKDLGSDIVDKLAGYIVDVVDDYIGYAHKARVHNMTLSVNGSDKNMMSILKDTNMNYYGKVPYGAINGNEVESRFMYQHIPGMKKQNGIYIPDNESISIDTLDTGNKELPKTVALSDGFKLVSPAAFEEEKIDYNKVLNGHITAMQDRDNFTIPLGEDKYFLQHGHGRYGLSKALAKITYVVLDENDNYSGYVNVLRTNADGKNVEIEIGIAPTLQHQGLGTNVIKAFYDTLFSTGVASVTSSVFDFNMPSKRLHEQVAELNGIRVQSYYINGKFWNMNIYSKVNDDISNARSLRKR